MPEINLNHFREVDMNRQVAITPDKTDKLNTEGERHVFLGRLVDKLTRTSEQKENYRAATKTFIDLVKQEYGDRIGNWATRELSEHVDKGKPLTGYRIEKILAKAEEAIHLQRNELNRYVDESVAKLVDEEIGKMGGAGEKVGPELREMMIEKGKDFVRGQPEFQNPGLLQESMEKVFGTPLREQVQGGLELMSKGLDLAKETALMWKREGKIYPDFNDSGVVKDFYNRLTDKMAEYGGKLENEGLVKGSQEFNDAMKSRLDILVGLTFSDISKSDGTGRGEIHRDEGTFLDKEIGLMRDAVDGLKHLSEEKKALLHLTLTQVEDLRDQISNLTIDQRGDLGLVLDLSAQIADLRNEVLALRPKFSEKEARGEWDKAMKEPFRHLPEGGTIESQFDRLKAAMLHKLNLPELIKTEDKVGQHFETMGLWKQELSKPQSQMLLNPVLLTEVLEKMSVMEKDLQILLDKPTGQNANLKVILRDALESLKFSQEAIQSQRAPMLEVLQDLKEAGFSSFMVKSFAKPPGSAGEVLSQQDLQGILQLLKNGATPEKILELRNQGKDLEGIREALG